MKINKHNLKMIGLRKACGDTKRLNPYDWAHLQISYDMDDGEILTDYHVGNSFTRYHSNSIFTVMEVSAPCTMQEIADAIADGVAAHCN